MKKILTISYCGDGVGSIRIAKFLKYLARADFSVRIISANEKNMSSVAPQGWSKTPK